MNDKTPWVAGELRLPPLDVPSIPGMPWAGQWAGVADILARHLRPYEDDPDVAIALALYERLDAVFPRPRSGSVTLKPRS
jgi:hypothetical protein